MKRLLLCALLIAAAAATAAERGVSISRDFGTLHGTLTEPETGSETVVLIIAGSGPTDRNGNNPAGLSTNAYLYLAQALEKAGIVSLRYDKRGIGSSVYDNPALMLEESLTIDTYIDDAEAWVDYLTGEGFRRIVLAGHSEGTRIALSVAGQNPAVNAVVSMAGAGYPMDEILQMQLAAQFIPNHIDLMVQANGIIAALKRGKRTDKIPEVLNMLFRSSVQPFLISSFRDDPRDLIRKLQVPVLIIQGDNDLQITPDNADELAKAQPRAKKVIIEGMTHTLKKCRGRTQTDQIGAYSDSTLSLDPDFAKAVTDFIRNL